MAFNLKDFLFEKAEVPAQKEEEKQVQTSPAQQPVATQPSYQPTTQYTPTTVIDKDILDFLNKKIEQNNLDGFDYFEFRKTVESNKNLIPDERTRFQTAYSFASTMNVDKTKLIETAKHYIEVINKEISKFNDAFNKSVDTEINSKENEIKSIDASVIEKTKQLEELNKQIMELQSQKTQLSSEIASNKIKLDANKNNFLYVTTTVIDGINSDINKITTYIG